MNLKEALAFAKENGVEVGKRQRDAVRKIEWLNVGEHQIEKMITSPVTRGLTGLAGLWTIYYRDAKLLDPNVPTRVLRLPIGKAIWYAALREKEFKRLSVHGLKPTPTTVAVGKVELPKLIFEIRVSKGGRSMTVYVSADDLDSAMTNTRTFFENPTITFVRGVDSVTRPDLEF